jgi:hypothetical protein
MNQSEIARLVSETVMATLNSMAAAEPAQRRSVASEPAKPISKKKRLAAANIESTPELKAIADDAIGYGLAAGESSTQMKVKVCELISEGNILNAKDSDEGFAAYKKLLEASTAIPEKVQNRNNGKMVPARFTSGPRKGEVKWAVDKSLSAVSECGREFIQAFIPMRDDQGFDAAVAKLFVSGVKSQFVTKEVILAVRKSYQPKGNVDPIKQTITNAKALKGVVDKYVTKKADAKKIKAELFPILDEIKATIDKLSK